MALRFKGLAVARHERPGWHGRRSGRALTGLALASGLSLALSACGGPTASKALDLSVTSGPVGTVVDVSGHAGPGCVVDTNWLGFDFGRYGAATQVPTTEMTTPVLTDGSWSASFVIPSYLGGTATGTGGSPTTPGRYEFAAKACKGDVLSTATFEVASPTPDQTAKDYVGIAATSDGQGYWLLQSNGDVAAYGDAHSYGSLSPGQAGSDRVIAMARTYDDHGYWLVGADGHVYSFGDAHAYGSVPADDATSVPITGMAVTPDGHGYWLLSANGHVYGFGDAHLDGDPLDNVAPYDAIVTRPAGGYTVTAADDAAAYAFPGGAIEPNGGGPGTALAASLVGAASTPSGNGTWQAGLDGGVVTTGDAAFYGSVPGENEQLKAPVTGIAASPDGHGYWLVGADGTVFTFGDAHFFGSPAKASK